MEPTCSVSADTTCLIGEIITFYQACLLSQCEIFVKTETGYKAGETL